MAGGGTVDVVLVIGTDVGGAVVGGAVVGGIVVGAISRSALSVSGPAAGLTTIVLAAITAHSLWSMRAERSSEAV